MLIQTVADPNTKQSIEKVRIQIQNQTLAQIRRALRQVANLALSSPSARTDGTPSHHLSRRRTNSALDLPRQKLISNLLISQFPPAKMAVWVGASSQQTRCAIEKPCITQIRENRATSHYAPLIFINISRYPRPKESLRLPRWGCKFPTVGIS